ncbi:uncharacterized protein CC84DRAFT_1159296 [Paraphaeosphaeria sporulosa]|uniref:PHD-type domain-containing protein n=1 Tax=Paraphaeosphaeria sporulosa TaxID=1460663 RepID=A0A177CYI2_9PLEO|nr:uncharacterized protein CC84DRAFT_1159296 [Paraphaeosphaeria sporulosa]OAG11880.1 hypothetical protein CC84DRAFT_1159296 [Paraphaeosphaeria sporulosa]
MPPAAGSRAAGPSTASDRRPTRQGRTTVRPTNYYARNFGGRSGGMEQTPEAANNAGGFCPALTHFSQAVDAFPKELIRHFSMFKEVEAKIHDPERSLGLMFDEIDQMPVPTRAERLESSHNSVVVENGSGTGANGGTMQDPAILWQQLAAIDPDTLSPREQANLKKRQAFCRLRMHIVNILPALDEKLVVLGGAKATKDKGLARMNNSYAHLDEEVSEEARYGSLSHWAYADKEEKKKGNAHERQRREVASANNLAAAAQHMHDVDSIAAKSEARREAMLANKRSRHQHVDSDFDDRPTKKPHKRKAMVAEAAGNDSRAVGLGITSNGAPSQGKRKKTEKALAAAVAAAPPMERSLSGALKAAAGAGGRSGTSPRATPSVEGGTSKRKPRAPPAPAQRKHALPTYSPQPASSPLVGNFSLPRGNAANPERPTAARARKNSIANSVASAAPEPPVARRPSSSHSVQQSTNSNAITELEQTANINRDNAPTKRASTPKDTTELPPFETIATATALKHEDLEPQEPESMEIDIPAPAPVNVRAGRASKTATPIVGTFPEIPMARSRSTRKANNGNGNSNTSSENNSTTTGIVSKRGYKKTTATNSATMHSPGLEAVPDPKSNPQSSRASSIVPEEQSQEAESDEDGDEPRYCYCNQVSFGNMIACDNDSCPREWFHLPCVNLDRAPSGRTKWFCSDECKEAHAKAKTGKGGRPGSSRQ